MTKRPRRGPGGKGTGLSRDAFPALRAFLRGYLHQDYAEVHGSLHAAADAFRGDASPAEREQLAQELVTLDALVTDLPARLLREFVEDLGGGWMPKSRGEIVELLEAIRAR